jgi:squalene synthase HpnC
MLVAEPEPRAPAPGTAAVMARAGDENFPVASRLLPSRLRAHLLAVYGFARLADELGDARDEQLSAAQRLAGLDELERDLDRAFAGCAENPLLVRLTPTLRECGLSREPFVRLIEANRTDQHVSRYQTWAQLRGYCALSANPVGEIVLGVLGRATAERIALSDSICTALQLAEHLQDVAEDVTAGRFYVPAEDLGRFGATHEDLLTLARAAPSAGAAPSAAAAREARAVKQTIAFEVRRARELLREGTPLIDTLRGRSRLAVAAFIAGGHAALDAIEHAGYEVFAGTPRASTPRRLISLAKVLARAGGEYAGRVHARRA